MATLINNFNGKTTTSMVRISIALLMLCLLVAGPARGAEDKDKKIALKDDHPERYTVVKGDTLWDISTKFLKSPWLWPKIWKINKQIANPHLIYPGDVILLRWVGGKPQLTLVRGGQVVIVPGTKGDDDIPIVSVRPTTLKTDRLSPRIRTQGLETAIPTIPPGAISAFLSRPSIVTRRQLNKSGYITIGRDNRLIMANGSEFYARGFKRRKVTDDEYFYIFRRGKALRGAQGARSRRVLAYEAVYLGEAQMMRKGDPAKLVVTRVEQEILPADRLLISPKHVPLPYFFPRPPKRQVKGSVIHALNSVSEIGPFTIVVIDLGAKHGMEPGNVLRVLRHVGKSRDPVTKRSYRIPDEESGIAMVFKVYKEVSYALIMTATNPINVLDTVITP